jgi:hypothetical protein
MSEGIGWGLVGMLVFVIIVLIGIIAEHEQDD